MIKGFTKTEMRVISISLVLMMLCAFLLANDRALNFLGITTATQESVARILTVTGDVRIKPDDAAKWSKAKSTVNIGDNIYVGDNSSAELELTSGAKVSVPAKAIFRIVRLEGIPCFDMLAGKFIWTYSGPQAVAVKGARGILSGDSATVEVSVDAGATDHQIKTIAGNPQLQLDKTASAPDETVAPKALPGANPVVFYVWRLEDYYLIDDQKLTPREKIASEVPLEVTLNWEHPSSGPFDIQISPASDLTKERRFYSTVDPSVTLEKAFLGENFWRVAFANTAWSQVQKFKVEPRYVEAKIEPAAKELKVNLRAQGEQMLRWNFSDNMSTYIAEVSSDANFAPGKTELKYLNAPEFVQEFPKPGIVYTRMRGLNVRQELTDWSPVTKVIAR